MSDLTNLITASWSASPRRIGRWVLPGAAVLAVILAANGSFFVVQPTEMAGVRRFGVVMSAAPIGQGLHFTAPFIEMVDHMQVSLTTFQSAG